MTMFAKAPKAELNHSNNILFGTQSKAGHHINHLISFVENQKLHNKKHC